MDVSFSQTAKDRVVLCRKGFRFLIFSNIATFWIPLVLLVTHLVEDKGPADVLLWFAVVAMVVNAISLFILILLFAKISRRYYGLLAVVPLSLIPFFGIIGFVIAHGQTTTALSRMGWSGKESRPSLRMSNLRIVLGKVILLCIWLVWTSLGVLAIYLQVAQNRNLELLRAGGQQTSGVLQQVTVHNGSYSFFIQYAGRKKEFQASRQLFEKHTLPGHTFTHHEIGVVYLPDKPEVAELPEMLAPQHPVLLGSIP